MSSPSTVLTLGYGTFGSTSLVVTLGFGGGEAAAANLPTEYFVIHGTDPRFHTLHGTEPRFRIVNGTDPTFHEVHGR